MIYKAPKKGEIRVVKRYAWLPVHLESDGKKIWLEHYYTMECYCFRFMGPGSLGRQCSDDPYLNSWKIIISTLTIKEIKEYMKLHRAYPFDFEQIFKETYKPSWLC